MTKSRILARNRLALAIEGGEPVRSKPFPAWPAFGDEEIEQVSAVLRSGKVNYWTGQHGREFEEAFAKACRTRHGVAVANGSVALDISLKALGVGPGDDVVVTSRSFVASAGCIVGAGARPIFADVDEASQNITAKSISAVITPNTKAVVAVHLAGWPCDMDDIIALSDQKGFRIIEDCAQAHGASYKGRPVGSFGDVAAFSFCQDKIMSTGGEGGMVVTNDHALWNFVWAYKDHGRDYQLSHASENRVGYKWIYNHIGTNLRMTEMQAVLGNIQLKRLPEMIAKRRENAAALTAFLASFPALRVATPAQESTHVYYKYYAFIRPELLAEGWNRDRVLSSIAAEGVPIFTGICPEIYREKAYQQYIRSNEYRPISRKLGETSLMFLVHPTISSEDVADICRAVEKVMITATAP